MAGRTGVYLHMMRRKPMSDAALDPAHGAALWSRCDALTSGPWGQMPPAERKRLMLRFAALVEFH